MIFFADNDGTITSSVPSPVYQGSANVNNIYLVAPFANSVVAVAFKLPNGVVIAPDKMTTVKELDGIINKRTGENYSVWSYSPGKSVLEHYGTVTVQFFFYASQDGVITATSSTSFPVGKGVPSVLPPDNPPADIYNAILNHLASIQEQIDNSYQAGFADNMQVVTQTLPEGEPARVDVTPVADTPPTAKAFKFDFFIPKGDTGNDTLFTSTIFMASKVPESGLIIKGFSATNFSRTPILSDRLLIIIKGSGDVDGRTWLANCVVDSIYDSATKVDIRVLTFVETTGTQGDKGDTGNFHLTGLRVDYNTQTGEINVNNDIYATALLSNGRYTYVELFFDNGNDSYNLPFAGCFISPNHGESDESYCNIEYNDGTHKVVISTCDDGHRNSVTYTDIKTDTVSFFVGEDGLMHYKVL